MQVPVPRGRRADYHSKSLAGVAGNLFDHEKRDRLFSHVCDGR
jgi:hypothetical protein